MNKPTSTVKSPANQPVKPSSSAPSPASIGLVPKRMVPVELGMTVALTLAVVMLALASLILAGFLGTKRTVPVAVDGTGRIIPVIALDQPHLPDNRILGFVDECLRRSFSHDFENFRITINEAKRCYTPTGAVEFEKAITPLIEDMRRMNAVMSVSLDASWVHQRYLREGIHVWEVQTPLTLHRRGTRESIAPTQFVVTTLVIRIPLESDVRGIAVRAINLRPAGRT